MAFEDLIKAKDLAVAHAAACREAEATTHATAKAAMEQTTLQREKADEAEAAIHVALHDLLKERGEHYVISKDGTLTVFKSVEAGQGWLAVQPIPGTLPPSPPPEEA